jgi:pilus assembly protein CpaD
MKMRKGFAIVLLASALAACTTPGVDQPTRGMVAANQPVVTRSDFAMDVAAPDGSLAASEEARLDGWFRGLGLGYGDNIYVDGDYSGAARADIARVAGRYGMLVNTSAAPVTAGNVQPGTVRVVVSRTRATMVGCPNWDRPAAPDFDNQQLPSMGCSVNGNLTAMVADPQDLVYGREAGSVIDAASAAKAVQSYRAGKPTGEGGLQDVNTKKGSK